MKPSQSSYIFFLGTNASLSVAEIWHVLSAQNYQPFVVATTPQYLTLTLAKPLENDIQNQLGGTDRISQIISVEDHQPTAEELGLLLSPAAVSGKKVTIGISTINTPSSLGQSLALELKRWLKQQGGKLRFVVPSRRASRLNAAQVIFNNLTSDPNCELTIIHHENKWFVTKTVSVQDIAAYEQRDTARPARDTYVGMLPPKLAQIMLNLALRTSDKPLSIYDPFCGLGTILQEGWLMGNKLTGSDNSSNMIEATQRNIASIVERFNPDPQLRPTVFTHDIQQPLSQEFNSALDAIVTEPYLGKPSSTPLPSEEIQHRMNDLLPLYINAFKNIRPILKPDGTVVFLLPAFRLKANNDHFSFMPESLLDEIAGLGYSIQHLVPDALRAYYRETERQSVVYARPDAVIGREVTIWQKV